MSNTRCPVNILAKGSFVASILIVYSTLLLIRRSLMSTANNLAVLIILSISGWLEFVHHFEIVVWSFPSCSASHLPVFFFSTSTNFIRFKSLFAIFLVCMSVCNNQNTKIKFFYEIPPQPTKKN